MYFFTQVFNVFFYFYRRFGYIRKYPLNENSIIMTAFEWYKRRLDTPRDVGGPKHLKFKIKLRIFENDQILMKTFKFQANHHFKSIFRLRCRAK